MESRKSFAEEKAEKKMLEDLLIERLRELIGNNNISEEARSIFRETLRSCTEVR